MAVDLVKIVTKIFTYRDHPEEMLKDCEKYGITGGSDQPIQDDDETEYEIKDILRHAREIYLMYKDAPMGGMGDPLFAYKAVLNNYFSKYEEAWEKHLWEEQYKKWDKEGVLCGGCKKQKMEYNTHGVLVETYEKEVARGDRAMSGGGEKILAEQEFQFHYYKCPNCGYFHIVEYRKTPTWLEDLFHINCPFKKGDLLVHFKDEHPAAYKHISYKITKW